MYHGECPLSGSGALVLILIVIGLQLVVFHRELKSLVVQSTIRQRNTSFPAYVLPASFIMGSFKQGIRRHLKDRQGEGA